MIIVCFEFRVYVEKVVIEMSYVFLPEAFNRFSEDRFLNRCVKKLLIFAIGTNWMKEN